MADTSPRKGLGVLCAQCLVCMHYGEYQTSNGALPRCELDNICLSIAKLGRISQESCGAFLRLPQKA